MLTLIKLPAEKLMQEGCCHRIQPATSFPFTFIWIIVVPGCFIHMRIHLQGPARPAADLEEVATSWEEVPLKGGRSWELASFSGYPSPPSGQRGYDDCFHQLANRSAHPLSCLQSTSWSDRMLNGARPYPEFEQIMQEDRTI